MAGSRRKGDGDSLEPVIENRRARHDFAIEETLECGLKLLGTEIKSIRSGKVSLAEGWVLAEEAGPTLTLMNTHVAEYPPAGIRRLATEVRAKGASLVPLKIYFVRGRAKLLIGVGTGRRKADKRAAIASREASREMDRAMSQRR